MALPQRTAQELLMIRKALFAALALVLVGMAPAAEARETRRPAAARAPSADSLVADAQQALDEQRLLDAGRILDRALVTGVQDPRLTVLGGELDLARGRPAQALASFTLGENHETTRARALQGSGIALSMLGRSDEALAKLRQAVEADARAWRAWNALGVEYDRRRDWTQAETAFGHALEAEPRSAPVLNNRGFSRLLQGRYDEAVSDLVAALERRPDMTAARTNLRLALALRGEYEQALAGGVSADRAVLLNNAGFAAIVRGDYARGAELLEQAISARGQYYGRATENLDLARQLAARQAAPANAAP
jgi:Flp pilus assembly protein TadD